MDQHNDKNQTNDPQRTIAPVVPPNQPGIPMDPNTFPPNLPPQPPAPTGPDGQPLKQS